MTILEKIPKADLYAVDVLTRKILVATDCYPDERHLMLALLIIVEGGFEKVSPDTKTEMICRIHEMLEETTQGD